VTTLCLANGMSVVCDVSAPYSGVYLFRDIFAPYYSLAIRQLTHQKSRRSSKGFTTLRANLPNRRGCATPLR